MNVTKAKEHTKELKESVKDQERQIKIDSEDHNAGVGQISKRKKIVKILAGWCTGEYITIKTKG